MKHTQEEFQYKLFPFSIIIDDGYGPFKYDIQLPGDVCTYDIIKAVCEKFQVELPQEGKPV
jgi:hypothetical protein